MRGPARIMEPGDSDHARAVAPLAAKYDQYRQRPHEGPVIAAEASERRARSAADAGAPRRP